MIDTTIATDRLLLRAWRDEDLDAVAALNADPIVMAYFPTLKSRDETREMMVKHNRSLHDHGFGFLACEQRETGALVGIVGMAWLEIDAEICPVVEIGWRLAHNYWGQGFASEAGRAWLDYGLTTKSLDRIVAITATTNQPSIAVMQRIGMTYVENGEFDHPALPKSHALSRHVLYEVLGK